MSDTLLPNRAGDAQRKLDELRAENTRLHTSEAHAECLPSDCEIARRVDGAERESDHLRGENTRQKVELEAANSARINAVAAEKQWHDQAERLRLENTPLREALRREVERIRGLTCPECGNDMDAAGDAKATENECECCDHGRKLRDEWAALLVPAVTGTTSDKATFRQPETVAEHLARMGSPAHSLCSECPPPALPLGHAFRAPPWGKDICDAKVDDHGRVRTCAQPQSDHEEHDR